MAWVDYLKRPYQPVLLVSAESGSACAEIGFILCQIVFTSLVEQLDFYGQIRDATDPPSKRSEGPVDAVVAAEQPLIRFRIVQH